MRICVAALSSLDWYKGITNRKKVTQEIKTIKAGKQNWKIGWEGAHWRAELFYLVRWWALFVCRDIRPVSRLSFGRGKQRKGSRETRRWGREGEHWGSQKKIEDWSRVIAHSVTFQVLMISLWERYRVGYFCNRRVYSTKKPQLASLLNKNRSTIIHIWCKEMQLKNRGGF